METMEQHREKLFEAPNMIGGPRKQRKKRRLMKTRQMAGREQDKSGLRATFGNANRNFTGNSKTWWRLGSMTILVAATLISGSGCGKHESERLDAGKAEKHGESVETPQERQAGSTKEIQLPGGASMVMVWCPAGTEHDGPRKPMEAPGETTLAGFWMGQTEVSQEQWESVMGDNPSLFKGNGRPVENVSWEDCWEFCRRTELRLPTESEWEVACRAGNAGGIAGDFTTDRKDAGETPVGWHAGNSGMETHPVGETSPNAWGLRDMSGNVWEWCEDSCGDGWHFLRGGSWCNAAERCAAGSRIADGAKQRDGIYGFRVCLDGEPLQPAVAESNENPAPSGIDIKAGTIKVLELPGDVPLEMVWCPPGSFVMGSPAKEKNRDDDETQHTVTLTEGFWLAKTEVTRKQWKSVMGTNYCNDPSRHGGQWLGNDLPVQNVNWAEGEAFCRKTGVRLPTEAEWEYACRAGATGPYAGTGKLKTMGWYVGNSEYDTHSVGRLKPNAWGLYDMHGNVLEWCADWYGAYPSGTVENPTGAGFGQIRVLRGGSYDDDEQACRSANRYGHDPRSGGSGHFGFRPAASAAQMDAITNPPKETRTAQAGEGVQPEPESANSASMPPIVNSDIEAGTVEVFELPGGVKMEFVWCPPGKFKMGSPSGEEGRSSQMEKQHTVTLTEGFWIAKYEVTRAQWEGVMGKRPNASRTLEELIAKRSDGGASFPVSEGWEDCMIFCLKSGLRLPTEAQWEYACRAGTKGAYAWWDLDATCWYGKNSEGNPHPVGEKQANLWGLHDMHGNVKEWCSDWLAPYTGEEETDPAGSDSGQNGERVCRGGDYGSLWDKCRSASRGRGDPNSLVRCGFRPVSLEGKMAVP